MVPAPTEISLVVWLAGAICARSLVSEHLLLFYFFFLGGGVALHERLVGEVGSKPIAFIDSDEVLFFHPLLAFLRVSCVSPSAELQKGDVIAGSECLRANHPSMVETPPSNEGIEVTYDSLLWSVSLLPQHLPDLVGVALDGFLTGCDDRFEA